MQTLKIIEDILENLDEARSDAGGAGLDNARAVIGKAIMGVERIKNNPGVRRESLNHVINLVSKLVDQETAIGIREQVKLIESGKEPGHQDTVGVSVDHRQKFLERGIESAAKTRALLISCCELMGEEPQDEEMSKMAGLLRNTIKKQMDNEEKLKTELDLMIATFQESLMMIEQEVSDEDDDSEIKKAINILSEPLPEDPQEAMEHLERARGVMLEATQKVGEASKLMKEKISSSIEKMQDMSKELQKAELMAKKDPMTGLGNRRRLTEFVDGLERATANCFLVIDIDLFKNINDTYGHDVGDEVLNKLSEILEECVRGSDLVVRMGGEEFCVVLPATPEEEGKILAEKIRKSIEIHPFATSAGKVDVSVSVGFAGLKKNESVNESIKRADKALYKAKNNGRNRVESA